MSAFPGSPKLLKGALIQFSAPLLVPVPNLIMFQYNPETLTRSLTPWSPPPPPVPTAPGQTLPRQPGQAGQEVNARAQPYDPEESFSVVLELDATDALEFPEEHPIAVATGVADRIAALEMLLYPSEGSTLGRAVATVGATLGGRLGKEVLECKTVPVVLFFWGPGRIVPVRIKEFSVDEQAFSPLLYPIRATVTVGMEVLPASAFPEKGAINRLARGVYWWTRGQKEALAIANLLNDVEQIRSYLPF